MIMKHSLAVAAMIALTTPSFAQTAGEALDCSEPENEEEEECFSSSARRR